MRGQRPSLVFCDRCFVLSMAAPFPLYTRTTLREEKFSCFRMKTFLRVPVKRGLTRTSGANRRPAPAIYLPGIQYPAAEQQRTRRGGYPPPPPLHPRWLALPIPLPPPTPSP